MGELEKEMLYKQNDRSPLLAGLCALTPTMGHLYVGKLSDRLKIKYLLSPPILLLPLAPPISLALFGHSDPHIGFFSFFYLYPLQLQDAIYLAYQHNPDLYEEIYGKEYIRPPKKSIIQKWIDKKEAKKDSTS